MTNSTTSSMKTANRSFARPINKHSDEAPMVITHLSGWIDVGEAKSNPTWIIPTKIHTPER